MDKTPAHVKYVRGQSRRISYNKQELVAVQTLFYAHRYKQCIALCEQLQRPEIHALHGAFLWFYHAISYEAIGILAHNFSQNKLHFLESARDSFNSSVKCLPLPYVSRESGGYEQPEDSPLDPGFHFTTVHVHDVPRAIKEPCPATPRITQLAPSSSTGSVYSTESPCPNVECMISEYGASPQKYAEEGGEHDIEELAKPENQLAVPKTPATHKIRLSRVLSSPQAFQEELVPSPLFSRNAKPSQLPQPSSANDNLHALPPLPFNHNATFKVQGTRIIQDPLRNTGVQTLIARFEGILPLPPSDPFSALLPAPVTPGITTPRFRLIRDAFSPNPHNEHLAAYLSSAASAQLTAYNIHLADFHAQLRKLIAYVDVELAMVRELQAERTAKKMLGPKQRFASFWTFEAKSPCLSRGREDRSNNNHEDCGIDDDPDGKAKTQEERIERLRREGWKVRKEKHGFRGVAFYDDLARQVEAELDRCLLA